MREADIKTKKELKLLKVIGQHADQNQNVESQFSFNHSSYTSATARVPVHTVCIIVSSIVEF